MQHDPIAPPIAGWFHLVDSSALEGGRIVQRHWMGQHVAVFMGQNDGVPRVVQAHCPHLGAAFARGGTIDGDTLTCPFHHWRFDGVSGQLVEVPYSDRKPPRVCLERWEAARLGDHVFALHRPSAPRTTPIRLAKSTTEHQPPPVPSLRHAFLDRDDPSPGLVPVGRRVVLSVPVPVAPGQALADPEMVIDALRVSLGSRVGQPEMDALATGDGPPRWRVDFSIEPDHARGWSRLFRLALSGPSEVEIRGPGLFVARAHLERPVRREFTTLIMPTLSSTGATGGLSRGHLDVGIAVYMHTDPNHRWPIDALVRRGARAVAQSVAPKVAA